jgi:hypothetical protein
MKRALMAWEIGDGYGHIENLIAIAQRLQAEGDWIIYWSIPRHATAQRNYLEARDFCEIFAFDHPSVLPRAVELGASSYLDMLGQYAYSSRERLQPLVDRVRWICEFVKPDLIFSECAPTFALVAPSVGVGTSFGLPASGGQKAGKWNLSEKRDAWMHDPIFYAIIAQCGLDRFQYTHRLAFCYPEMNCYDDACESIGPVRKYRRWADCGTDIFAYLDRNHPHLHSILDACDAYASRMKVKADIYIKGQGEPFNEHRMMLAGRLVHHGSAGMAHAGLQLGIPQFCFPFHAENTINTRRLMDIGVANAAGYAEADLYEHRLLQSYELELAGARIYQPPLTNAIETLMAKIGVVDLLAKFDLSGDDEDET